MTVEPLRDGPLPLALLRVVVAGLILALPAVHAAPAMVDLPPVHVPLGTGWLLSWLTPAGAQAAWWGVVIGAVAGGLGLRAGFWAVTLCGVYLLAIPQLRGGVQHYHHLLWLSALLAVSPCADALTPWRWRPAPGRSLGWGLPTRAAWLLLALVYFFPGLHKVAAQGPGWAGDNLRWLLLWKWAQAWDFTPLIRLDQHPGLLRACGVGVLLLELLFPLALLDRRSRLLFAAGGLLFHAGTLWLLDIDFGVLVWCYVIFLPWPAGPQVVERPWRGAAAVSALLVLGVVSTGVMGVTQGWPFACYPAFERPVGPWMPTLLLVAVDADGTEQEISERLLVDAHLSQAWYSEAWGMAGLYGVDDPAARRSFWARVRGRPGVEALTARATEISFYRADLRVDSGEVRRGALVDRLALEP